MASVAWPLTPQYLDRVGQDAMRPPMLELHRKSVTITPDGLALIRFHRDGIGAKATARFSSITMKR